MNDELRELAPGSFVYELRNALTPALCADMITRFEERTDQQYAGLIGPELKHEESIKRSTDLRVSGRDDWRDIDEALHASLSRGLRQLARLHPYFAVNSFKDVGYNLQRTREGEFYHWHIDAGPSELSQRQLVAIWYLNDVPSSGETEFHFQDLKVAPETGKLILFPPFWTHLHRGAELGQGVKYIATTWVSFV